jgi:hypothetical protein
MQSALTFIIPVCHPHNARDWNQLKSNLAHTVKSVSAQLSGEWNAIIIANYGSDLPPLPDGFAIHWVDFPPNPVYEQGSVDQEQFRDGVRLDKGRRILAGMLHAGKMGHVMVVDADDFISNRLAGFAAENREKPGWYMSKGYGWSDGGKMLYLYSGFHLFCGTSHIVRSDLFNLPQRFEEASDVYIRRMLGSHIYIDEYLRSSGTPLNPLPFTGAIYRIGHAGSHSKSAGLWQSFFLTEEVWKRPLSILPRIFRLRILRKSLQREFFGSA